jgi:hypothetical protein
MVLALVAEAVTEVMVRPCAHSRKPSQIRVSARVSLSRPPQ